MRTCHVQPVIRVACTGALPIVAACLLVVLVGCSTPSSSSGRVAPAAAAPSSDPDSGALARPSPREHSGPRETVPPAREQVGSDAGTAALDEHLEQADIDGAAGIHVTVRWATDTGQHHCAKHLTITTRGGVLRLESPYRDGIPEEDAPAPEPTRGDVLTGPLYPLLDRILVAGRERWVILGWSSFGEGLQTEHAWLIEDRQGPKLVDSLTWTTDRSHAGLAIDGSRTPPEVRIGIPLPQEPGRSELERAEGDDGRHPLHLPGAWELVHGEQRWDLRELRRLPAVEQHVMSLPAYYDPPFQVEPSRRHWEGRFVWFSAQHQFTLMQPGRH